MNAVRKSIAALLALVLCLSLLPTGALADAEPEAGEPVGAVEPIEEAGEPAVEAEEQPLPALTPAALGGDEDLAPTSKPTAFPSPTFAPTPIPSPAPLRMVSHPSSVTAMEGETVRFTAYATGADDIAYQWVRSADGESWEDVPSDVTGYNAPTLELTADRALNGTRYYCVATADGFESAVSTAATLTVREIYTLTEGQSAEAALGNGEQVYFRFTPAQSGLYTLSGGLTMDDGSGAWPDCRLYDGDMNSITSGYLSSGVSYLLRAGETYYYSVSFWNGPGSTVGTPRGTLRAELTRAATSGTYGPLTWSIDQDSGVLTISGEGDMPDAVRFADGSPAPWSRDWYQYITAAVLEPGVTSVGNWVFSACINLTDVTIPAGVTRIGDWAFSICSSLENVTLPGSVTSIGDSAFDSCTGLTGVTIPAGVTSIGEQVFASCTGLTGIEVDERNERYASYDGALADRAAGELLCYPAGKAGDYTVPSGVTSIGDYAFSGCESLTGVTLPDGLTRIGDRAFYSCRGLTGVTLPEGLTSIGDDAFGSCESLTGVTLPGGLTRIGDGAFQGCDGLTSVTIPGGVTSIGDGAFRHCYHLESVGLAEGVAELGNSAFAYCTALARVSLPLSLRHVGAEAFGDASALTELTYPGTEDDWRRVAVDGGNDRLWELLDFTPGTSGRCGDNAFWSLDGGTLTITGTGATYDYAYLWYFIDQGVGYEYSSAPWNAYAADIRVVVVEPGITALGSYLFYGFETLASVTLPAGLTGVGERAFSGCTALESVTVPDGVTDIGENAFSDCAALKSAVLPDSLTDVSRYIFYGCESLESVTLPRGAARIGGYAFYGCESLADVTLPSGVALIEYDAFEGCASLARVAIPESVTSIGDAAFGGCTTLATIDFMGDAPELSELAFVGVTATATYPGGNATWTEAVRQDYGGTITWVSPARTQVNTDTPLTPETEKELREKAGIGEDDKNVVTYDVRLLIQNADGEWVELTNDNFPEEGISIALPYPAGTDKTMLFVIYHLVESTGEVETLIPARTDDGLVIAVHSLSPFAVTWDGGADSRVAGDATGDGKVDGRDLLRLQKHLAGIEGTVVDLAACDVTGDGKVDGRDLLRLQKYLAGIPGTVLV